MPLVGFEPTISACERPKTYALDRAATGTGPKLIPAVIFPEHLQIMTFITVKLSVVILKVLGATIAQSVQRLATG